VLLPAGLGRVRGDGLALAHARDLHPARRDALLREIRRDGVRAALRERLVVVLGARRVRVADDERVRVRVLVQAAREVHEVLPGLRAERERVEVEQDRVVERDPDTGRVAVLAGNRLDGRVLELLVELLGLLVHLVADDGAGGAADGRADDGAARRRAGGLADHAADDGAGAGADHGALAGLAHVLAPEEGQA